MQFAVVAGRNPSCSEADARPKPMTLARCLAPPILGIPIVARRKLLYLQDAAVLSDLRAPPGNQGITAAVALDLAEVLGTSPMLWMNIQATFDLDKAMKARRVA